MEEFCITKGYIKDLLGWEKREPKKTHTHTDIPTSFHVLLRLWRALFEDGLEHKDVKQVCTGFSAVYDPDVVNMHQSHVQTEEPCMNA